MLSMFVLGLSLASPVAHAGKCDSLLKKADSAKGPALAKSFGQLAGCDKELAEQHYKRFMAGATDADALVGLSLAAINGDVWNPVWQQLSLISDYDARDEVARRLGEMCNDEAKVVPFLQGAYFGLRDIDFQQWDDAYSACENGALTAWLTKQVATPPNKIFDEKYNVLMTTFVEKKGADALPTLAKGAIKAAAEGPYDAILMKMDEAVATELGGTLTEEDRKLLEAALIEVARAVDPEKARSVADRLATSGSESAAAKLLPAIYPDRTRNGSFRYGAVSIESGECKGDKLVVLHVATVSEPGKRWLITEAAQGPMRAFKPKLKKCSLDDDTWPVATTPEPLKSDKDLDAWVERIEQGWVKKGYEVKVQSEKGFQID
jgi:hypothetical protein